MNSADGTEVFRVVGFCGIAVGGGAGIKPPLFATSAHRFFVNDLDPLLPPRFICDTFGMGYVTLSTLTWPRGPHGVVLYADRKFLDPNEYRVSGESPGPMLKLDPGPLTWDSGIGLFLDYLEVDRALAVMRNWGKSLLDDARQVRGDSRNRQRLLRALDDVQRARLVLPLPRQVDRLVRPPLEVFDVVRDMRVEMFVELAAVFEALGRDAERVFRDAKRDFDGPTVAEIHRRVQALSLSVHAEES